MSKLIQDWTPSKAAIDLIKLNGVSDAQIKKSESYLKNQEALTSVDDLSGYDNWDSFFIVFCIKANRKSDD